MQMQSSGKNIASFSTDPLQNEKRDNSSDTTHNIKHDLWEAMLYSPIAGNYSNFWRQSNATQMLGYAKLAVLLWDAQGKTILDYGCGTGEFTKIMNEKGAHVIGVDVSQGMIAIARDNDTQGDYRLIKAWDDLQEIPCVDDIMINYVFCTFDKEEKIQTALCLLSQLIKIWWKIYIQNGNRDDANWLDFLSFWLEKKENLKEWDEIYAILKWVASTGDLRVKDFFFSKMTYMQLLMKAGFTHIKIYEMKEEQTSDIAPVYIIEWTKLS